MNKEKQYYRLNNLISKKYFKKIYKVNEKYLLGNTETYDRLTWNRLRVLLGIYILNFDKALEIRTKRLYEKLAYILYE